MIKPYKILSKFYDKDEWGKFSLQYVKIINYLKREYELKLQSILDISCGTGDLIYELSKEYKVVGSDISEEMIEIAKLKYPEIDFTISDMSDFHGDFKFDLILSPFDSVNYIMEESKMDKVVHNIKAHLNSNGHFLFDFNTEKMYVDKHHGIFDRNTCGIKYRQICEYDIMSKTAKTIFDFGNEKELHIQKAYNLPEIRNILFRHGLKIKYSYDIYKQESVNENSYKVVVLAGSTDGNGA